MLIPKSKLVSSLGVFIVIGLFLLVACLPAQTTPTKETAEASPSAKVTITPGNSHNSKITPTPVVTRQPTDTPDEITQNCCANLKSALLHPLTTLNYWRYLSEDQSPWAKLVLDHQAPALFTNPAMHLPQRLDFVPALAFTLPSEAKQQDDFWVISVEMISDATWSDGQPITAHDVVFTINTVFDLKLPGNWAAFYPEDILAKAEAKADHTVAFYFKQEPGLGEWQFAVAKGPILPEHYWSEYVERAKANIAGIAIPLSCSGQLTLEEVSACQAYERARQILFEVEPKTAPSGGGYIVVQNSSSSIRLEANPNFYGAGIKITEYADGTWERVFPDGTVQQFYGEAGEEALLSYRHGPYSPVIEYKVYESPAKAYDALLKGQLNTVFNPYGQTDDWILRAIQSKEIIQYPSQLNGLTYLGFNLRRAPGALPEFRQAVEYLIDRQAIVEKDLEDLVYPAFSIIPSENAFWWNSSGIPEDETLTTPERLEMALQTLKEAGWTWKVEPVWNPGTRQVVPGEEPRTADGQLLPEIQFVFPLHDEDLLMSTFGEAISESLLNLGLPLMIERLPREQIINRTLVGGGSFDLYILDWRFPLYPDYLCELFMAENDTLLNGGYNTTGYNSARFDETCVNFMAERDNKLAQDLAFRLQSQLAFDRPYLPLYHPKIIDLLNISVVPPYGPQLNGFAGSTGFQTDVRILLAP